MIGDVMPECAHEYRWQIVKTRGPFGVYVKRCDTCGATIKLEKNADHVRTR